MKAVRRTATIVLTAGVALALAACGPTAGPGDAGRRQTTPPSSQAPRSTQEDGMRIRISIGDQQFQATLDDSPATRDLAAQLPLSVEMSDHGSVEKTGPLPSPLSLDGQPDGADPDVGDVGYYAPGNDLVLYYGDQSYYNGIVVLGRMHDDAAERIANIDGSITATITALDN
ncbi:cyclophilin-like fold protein [Kribbella swartbergensis]